MLICKIKVTTRETLALNVIATRVDPLIHISDTAELAIHLEYWHAFADI